MKNFKDYIYNKYTLLKNIKSHDIFLVIPY